MKRSSRKSDLYCCELTLSANSPGIADLRSMFGTQAGGTTWRIETGSIPRWRVPLPVRRRRTRGGCILAPTHGPAMGSQAAIQESTDEDRGNYCRQTEH